jgi:hypothetical protein
MLGPSKIFLGVAEQSFELRGQAIGEREQQHHAEHVEDGVEECEEHRRPALRTEDFDTEKLVILEEIRMYDDQPPFGADDRCRAAFFGRHPLARSVLGTVESIEALPVEAMRDYHRRRYCRIYLFCYVVD